MTLQMQGHHKDEENNVPTGEHEVFTKFRSREENGEIATKRCPVFGERKIFWAATTAMRRNNGSQLLAVVL